MDINALDWLMNWYSTQCNGEWEHRCGISLQSTDNPGWWLKIDLTGTGLEKRPFLDMSKGSDGDPSWSSCKVEDGRFDAGCGPGDLADVIGIFRSWAEGPMP